MRFIYNCFELREDDTMHISRTTINIDDIKEEYVTHPNYVSVFDTRLPKHSHDLKTVIDLEEWRVVLERASAWKPEYLKDKKVESDVPFTTFKTQSIESQVNPRHYKNYIDDYQWLDAMSRIPSFREPAIFKGALELQIRKYLDRKGQKDADLQELKKALFYLQYQIKYIENGNKPVSAEDVHASLK